MGCATCTQLTSVDVHFPGYAAGPSVHAVPAWRQLSALSGLRRLHASTGVGWDAEGFAAVLAAATALRGATITDNTGAGEGGSNPRKCACTRQLHGKQDAGAGQVRKTGIPGC